MTEINMKEMCGNDAREEMLNYFGGEREKLYLGFRKYLKGATNKQLETFLGLWVKVDHPLIFDNKNKPLNKSTERWHKESIEIMKRWEECDRIRKLGEEE